MKSPLSYLVAARQSEISELERIRDACALVQSLCRLIHQLQCERGLSNLFLASAGARCAARLAGQMRAVDADIALVNARLGQQDAGLRGGHGARLFNSIAYLLQGLAALPRLRERIAGAAISTEESTAAFARLIAACLAVVFEAADSACDPDISRLLVAMFHFMQGKEFAGQERATGAAAFGSGASDAARQHHWLHLIESQEGCFQVFSEFAPPWLARLQAEQSVNCSATAAIERLRRIACTARADDALDAAMGERWFSACTQRLDAMHAMEQRLADELARLCERKLEIAHGVMAEQQAMLLAEERSDIAIAAAGAEGPERADSMGFFTSAACAPGAVPPGVPGLGPQLERSVLGLVQEQARQLHAMQAEIDKARNALQERKAIERAKGVLMQLRQLSEGDAHKLMRQAAMNQNRRMLDVAQAVLSMSELMPGAPAASHAPKSGARAGGGPGGAPALG